MHIGLTCIGIACNFIIWLIFHLYHKLSHKLCWREEDLFVWFCSSQPVVINTSYPQASLLVDKKLQWKLQWSNKLNLFHTEHDFLPSMLIGWLKDSHRKITVWREEQQERLYCNNLYLENFFSKKGRLLSYSALTFFSRPVLVPRKITLCPLKM